MDVTGWMILFCAIICLAILVQTGALLGMFLHVREISKKLDDFRAQISGRLNALATELQSQTHTLGDKANQAADIIKAEVTRLEEDIEQVRASAEETMQTVRELGGKARRTVNRLLYIIDMPARETQALSKAIRTGFLALLERKPRTSSYKRTA